MTFWQLVQMMLLGAAVQVATRFLLLHAALGISQPQAFAVGMWFMLLSWWIFLRKVPTNKNIHFGVYAGLSLVVVTCATCGYCL